MFSRRPFGSSCVFAAVFIVSTSGASAQTTAVPGFTQPDDDETVVRKLLQSTDPRAQAWGAWYAGRDQMRQLAPLVHAVIAQHAFGTSLPESAAVEVSLDTLIQLKVPTPAPLLAAVYERRPAQSLILAAIADRDDQEIEPFLLGVLARDKYDEWFAAANTLLGRRASGLAVSIIRALRIPVHVYITRDGRTTGGGSGTGMGVGMGCGAIGAARGLPPWADYRLATSAHPGYVVLSTGPTTVYYQRIVTAAGSTPARSVVERDGPAADDRLRYLAALAGLSATLSRCEAWSSAKSPWQLARLPTAHSRLFGVGCSTAGPSSRGRSFTHQPFPARMPPACYRRSISSCTILSSSPRRPPSHTLRHFAVLSSTAYAPSEPFPGTHVRQNSSQTRPGSCPAASIAPSARSRPSVAHRCSSGAQVERASRTSTATSTSTM